MENPPSLPKIQPAGLKSPTVISLQLAGWLVFICLWLPLCRGCGGAVDKIPIDTLQFPPFDAKNLAPNFMLLGAYCNGLFVAFYVCLSAWFVSEKLWKSFFLTQLSVTVINSVTLLCFSMVYSDSSRELAETILGSFPTLVGFSVWIGIPIRRNDYPVAWARLQHSWTLGAFFFVHLLMLFQGDARYGYWVTMVGLVSLLVAVEIARYRMPHDLWDSSVGILRPRFTIRNILCWTALFPVVFSYFQAIRPICDWLFR